VQHAETGGGLEDMIRNRNYMVTTRKDIKQHIG
jgi:hypothetical protein